VERPGARGRRDSSSAPRPMWPSFTAISCIHGSVAEYEHLRALLAALAMPVLRHPRQPRYAARACARVMPRRLPAAPHYARARNTRCASLSQDAARGQHMHVSWQGIGTGNCHEEANREQNGCPTISGNMPSFTLKEDGGYSDDPADPGGAPQYGHNKIP